jgi:hypothetical protein
MPFKHPSICSSSDMINSVTKGSEQPFDSFTDVRGIFEIAEWQLCGQTNNIEHSRLFNLRHKIDFRKVPKGDHSRELVNDRFMGSMPVNDGND